MNWTNLHTHTWYSDGSSHPQEYVKTALENRMQGLGFSEHAPLPFPNEWAIEDGRIDEYIEAIAFQKQAHSHELPIFTGLEIDYVPDVISPRDKQWDKYNLDYRIGSVHFVDYFENGEPWNIDGPLVLFEYGLNSIFGKSIEQAVGRYYELVRDMVRNHCPDILGHMDVMKKNNAGGKFFYEDEAWYKREIEATLDVIARSDVIVEVNLGGLIRKRFNDFYPSQWILERMVKMDIPITISSDAHKPHQVISKFGMAARTLQEIGYHEITVLTPHGWQQQELGVVTLY